MLSGLEFGQSAPAPVNRLTLQPSALAAQRLPRAQLLLVRGRGTHLGTALLCLVAMGLPLGCARGARPGSDPTHQGATSSPYGPTGSGALPSTLAVPPPASEQDPGPLLPEVHTAQLKNGTFLHVVERAHATTSTLHVVIRVASPRFADRRLASWALHGALEAAAQSAPRKPASLPRVEVTPRAAHLTWTGPSQDFERTVELVGRMLQSTLLGDFESLTFRREAAEAKERRDPAALAQLLGSLASEGSTALPARPGLFESQRWLKGALRPTNVHVVVIGATTPARAESTLSRALQGWEPAPETPSGTTPPAPSSALTSPSPLLLGDVEGSTWAQLRISFPRSRHGTSGTTGSSTLSPEREWTLLRTGLEALPHTEPFASLPSRFGARVTPSLTPARDRWLVHIDVATPAEQLPKVLRDVTAALERLARDEFASDALDQAHHALRARLRRAQQDPAALAQVLGEWFEGGLEPARLEAELAAPSSPGALRAFWWPSSGEAPASTLAVVGDARRLERALSSFRDVVVVDPKRELRLLRRIPRDPEASPEVASTSTEEQD